MIDKRVGGVEIEKLKDSIVKTMTGISALENEFVGLSSLYLGEEYGSLVWTQQFLLPYTVLIKSVDVNHQIFGYSLSCREELFEIEQANSWLEFSRICRAKGLSKTSLIKLLRSGVASRSSQPTVAFSVKRLLMDCFVGVKLFLQQKMGIEIREIGLVSDTCRVFGFSRIFDLRFLAIPDKYSGNSEGNDVWAKRLAFYDSMSQKVNFSDLSWILFFIVPPSVLENIKVLHANSSSVLSQVRVGHTISIFCLTSHFSSDLLRMIRFGKNLGCDSTEKVLNVVQHGGQFGTQLIVVTEWMDMFLADRYLVFGNPKNYGVAGGEYVSEVASSMGLETNITSVIRAPSVVKLGYKADPNPSGHIVLILPTAPAEAHHVITCGLIASNAEVFYGRIAQFVRQLESEIEVKIKMSPKKFGLTYEDYCHAHGTYPRFVGGSVVDQIIASRLAIIAYDGTAALEALALGRPFVWVIDSEFFPLRCRMQSALVSVMGSGVVHSSFESALDFLQNLKNIYVWWLAPETRKTIEYLRSEIGVMLV